MATFSRQTLCHKYRNVYIVVNDLAKEEEEGTSVETPLDFKFTKPSLLGNNEERFLHAQPLHSQIYEFIRRLFFSISQFSFAFQARNRSDSWLVDKIKRLFCIRNTKSNLHELFKRMNTEELCNTIDFLNEFHEASKHTHFAFTDASLLFIPVIRNGQHSLKIRLIDLFHAMEDSEKVNGFEIMQEDFSDSILDLIAVAEEVLQAKTPSSELAQLASSK